MTRRRTAPSWPDLLSSVTEPSFAGPGWRHAHGTTWVYQDAPGATRVNSALRDDGSWSMELWSAQNRLLAHGSAPVGEVGALAPALTAKATRWAPPSGIEASQLRFAETAEAVRAGRRPAPDEARIRAATAPSPASARSTRPPATAAPPLGARPAPPGAARLGR